MHACVFFFFVFFSFPLVSSIYSGARLEQRFCITYVNKYKLIWTNAQARGISLGHDLGYELAHHLELSARSISPGSTCFHLYTYVKIFKNSFPPITSSVLSSKSVLR